MISQILWSLAITVVFLGWVGIIAQFVFRHLFTYNMDDKRVWCSLIDFIPIFSIKIQDIASIKEVKFIESIFKIPVSTLRLGNRLFFTTALHIVMKRGIFRSIIITPDDPKEFIQTIKPRFESIPPMVQLENRSFFQREFIFISISVSGAVAGGVFNTLSGVISSMQLNIWIAILTGVVTFCGLLLLSRRKVK